MGEVPHPKSSEPNGPTSYLLRARCGGNVHSPLVCSGIGKLMYMYSRSLEPFDVHTPNDDKLVTTTNESGVAVHGILPSGKNDESRNVVVLTRVAAPTERS